MYFFQCNALCSKLTPCVLFFIVYRITPKNDFIESAPLQSSCSQIPDVSQSASVSLLVYSASDARRELDSGNSSNP